MLRIFHVFFWPSVGLLLRNVYLDLPSFWLGYLLLLLLFFILNCRSCLYILEINPVSFALFANIFSYSEGDLFIYFLVSFGVQKFPSLIGSHSFILIFIFITLGGELRAILLWFTSKSVLCFTLRVLWCPNLHLGL